MPNVWHHSPLHRLSERGAYIVTAGTHLKQHFFQSDVRLDFLQDRLLSLAADFGWNLQAWAVFSNHYHFVADSPDNPDCLSAFLRELHSVTAIEVNRLDGADGRQVWFQFWDTHLTIETSYFARLNYVMQNAVRHGLVKDAADYRWCSAGWFRRIAPRALVRKVATFAIDRVRVRDDFEVRWDGGARDGATPIGRAQPSGSPVKGHIDPPPISGSTQGGSKLPHSRAGGAADSEPTSGSTQGGSELPHSGVRSTTEPERESRERQGGSKLPHSKVHIAVLSAGEGWHVQDLLRAGGELGHRISVLPFGSLCGRIGGAGAAVGAGGVDLASVDRVLVRIVPPGSLEQVVFRMDALHRLEAAGVPVINSAKAVETAVDKYLATARLHAAGLPVPETIACESAEAAQAAFEELGGDVVLKPLFGSQGRGMMRLTDPDLAARAFGVLERLGSVLYLQRFVDHPGWDLRAFVLGGRVLAAMRRRSATDWRTNFARGARCEAAELDERETDLAVRAAAAVGARIAGVDLLPGPGGERYVLEVNAVPGWEALSRACRLDVAAEVLNYVAREG